MKTKKKPKTKRKIVSAKNWIAKRDANQLDENTLTFKLSSHVKDDGMSKWSIWETEDGKYRVFLSEDKFNSERYYGASVLRTLTRAIPDPNKPGRIIPNGETYQMWDSCELDPTMQGYYARSYSSMRRAAEVCLKHSGKLDANIDALVTHNESVSVIGHSSLPMRVQKTERKRDLIVNVEQRQVKNKEPKAPGEKRVGSKRGPRNGGEAHRVFTCFGNTPTYTAAQVAKKMGLTEGRINVHLNFWEKKGGVTFKRDGDKVGVILG
jgi:hypothetical protein